MSETEFESYVAFLGDSRIASGGLATIATAIRDQVPAGSVPPLVFSARTGRQVDVDSRGSDAELAARYGEAPDGEVEPLAAASPRRGRPKPGVKGREVTLLPRQWAWLDEQPGGASGALRRLVDEGRERNRDRDRVRLAQDRSNRLMSALAGNLAGFEEATRALYANDQARFLAEIKGWPGDIRAVVTGFSSEAFS